MNSTLAYRVRQTVLYHGAGDHRGAVRHDSQKPGRLGWNSLCAGESGITLAAAVPVSSARVSRRRPAWMRYGQAEVGRFCRC